MPLSGPIVVLIKGGTTYYEVGQNIPFISPLLLTITPALSESEREREK